MLPNRTSGQCFRSVNLFLRTSIPMPDPDEEVELWMKVQEAWERFYDGRGDDFKRRFPEEVGIRRVARVLKMSERRVEELLTR